MKIYATYRLMASVLSFAILLSMALPSGLQAKQLLDYCMTEMNHHTMMDDSHDCCLADNDHHSEASKTHHDCEGESVCACSVNMTPFKDKNGVPTSTSSAVVLAQTGFNFTITSPDEIIHKDLKPGTNQYNPPLYLLYDTFLN